MFVVKFVFILHETRHRSILAVTILLSLGIFRILRDPLFFANFRNQLLWTVAIETEFI